MNEEILDVLERCAEMIDREDYVKRIILRHTDFSTEDIDAHIKERLAVVNQAYIDGNKPLCNAALHDINRAVGAYRLFIKHFSL